MPDVSIRPLIAPDIPLIAGWMAATPLWQRYQLTEAKARASLEQGANRADMMLVADVDDPPGQACGLAWCLREGAFGRSFYLRILGVQASHAGLGIGAALLTRAEQIAAEAMSAMFLLVSDFNIEAQRFYQRQGYTQIGAIPGYVLPDITELLYWKRLSNEL